MNRIEESIARCEKALGTASPDAVARVADATRIDAAEHATYQLWKSLAQVEGLLTLDEALTVYAVLGAVAGDDGWSAGASLAAKVTVTKLMTEIGPLFAVGAPSPVGVREGE